MLQGLKKRTPRLSALQLTSGECISLFLGQELQTLSLSGLKSVTGQMHDWILNPWIVASKGGPASQVKEKRNRNRGYI